VRRRARAALIAVAGCCGLAAGAVALPATRSAAADSYEPIVLATRIAPVARLQRPLPIAVTVSADRGALDDRSAPLRIEVKLAEECGGAYQDTPGVTLLDRQLRPEPQTGRAYRASFHGAGRPQAYGAQTVCEWLEEEGDNRLFASDQSLQVDVSRACTSRAARYDAARRALARAQRRHRAVPRARRAAGAARRAARRACGAGVAL
jgi:hypothetical protein